MVISGRKYTQIFPTPQQPSRHANIKRTISCGNIHAGLCDETGADL
jgi:hypothetical protein